MKITENNLNPNLSPMDKIDKLFDQFHLIIWRMNLDKKEIEIVNHFPNSPWVDFSKRMLMDLLFAKEMIEEKDFPRYKFLMQELRQTKAVSGIFRVHFPHESIHWLKIIGVPNDIKEPTLYYGFVMDISEDVNQINRLLQKDVERQLLIESHDYPVLLVEMEKQTIISRNSLATSTLEYGFQDFTHLDFADIFAKSQARLISRIYEISLLHGEWKGRVKLLKKTGGILESYMKTKLLNVHNRNLLKVVFLDESRLTNDKILKGDQTDSGWEENLLSLMREQKNINGLLHVLLNQSAGFDSLVFFNIDWPKNRLDIFACGDAFSGLKPEKDCHNHNIIPSVWKEKKLSHIIIDDTLESRQLLEWALLIPYGIRSYLAKPYYRQEKLRSILFFCNREANGFVNKNLQEFASLHDVFRLGLKHHRSKIKG